MFNHELSKKAVDLVRAQHGGLSLCLQVKNNSLQMCHSWRWLDVGHLVAFQKLKALLEMLAAVTGS